jgi:hypothetical protein
MQAKTWQMNLSEHKLENSHPSSGALARRCKKFTAALEGNFGEMLEKQLKLLQQLQCKQIAVADADAAACS